MAKVIYKFQLKDTNVQQIEMPKGAEILDIQSQMGAVCMWALCEGSEKDTSLRTFELYGTGQFVSGEGSRRYVGTCLLNGGILVMHCFERL